MTPLKHLTILFTLSANLLIYSQNHLTGLGETRLSIQNEIDSKHEQYPELDTYGDRFY